MYAATHRVESASSPSETQVQDAGEFDLRAVTFRAGPPRKPWAELSPGERVLAHFSPAARWFVASLIDLAARHGSLIWPNMTRRGARHGLTRAQTRRVVETMERLGWLLRRGRTIANGQCVYTYYMPVRGLVRITQTVRDAIEAMHRRGGGRATGRLGGRPRKVARMGNQSEPQSTPTLSANSQAENQNEPPSIPKGYACSGLIDISEGNLSGPNGQHNQVGAPTAPSLGASRSKLPETPTRIPSIPDLGMVPGRAGNGPDLIRSIRDLGERLLPPFPGHGLIAPAVTPPPRLLDPKLHEEARVRAVYNAYWAALDLRYPEVRHGSKPAPTEPTGPAKRPRKPKAEDPFWGGLSAKTRAMKEAGRPEGPELRQIGRSHKLWPVLVEAAELLIAAEIPPVAWCLFSMDCWMFYMGDKAPGAPRMRWALSPNRLRERADWYRDEAGRYVGGQTYVAPEHTALMRAHRALWDALMVAAPKSRSEVMGVLDKILPGDTWERMVASARAGTARLQADLDAAVARGVAW